jgi:hypothetical protein
LSEEEIWKDIPGFNNYKASSLGNIKSPRDKILKPRIHYARGGKIYWRIDLGRANRTCYVHRLVCLAFHGEPPDPKMEAGHKDDDGNNNRADNLIWLTKSENRNMIWTNHKSKGIKWGCVNCPCLENTHDESGQCWTKDCNCSEFKRRKINTEVSE